MSLSCNNFIKIIIFWLASGHFSFKKLWLRNWNHNEFVSFSRFIPNSNIGNFREFVAPMRTDPESFMKFKIVQKLRGFTKKSTQNFLFCVIFAHWVVICIRWGPRSDNQRRKVGVYYDFLCSTETDTTGARWFLNFEKKIFDKISFSSSMDQHTTFWWNVPWLKDFTDHNQLF